MAAKDEAERCRAVAAAERTEADAALLDNVRTLRLRSAARWDELAERHERVAAAIVLRNDGR